MGAEKEPPPNRKKLEAEKSGMTRNLGLCVMLEKEGVQKSGSSRRIVSAWERNFGDHSALKTA